MTNKDLLIKEITSVEKKSVICSEVLRALPDWFGNPEAIVDYTAGVQNKPLYAVFDENTAVGFVSIEVHNPFTAEIYVMGILEAYHRQGLGKKLVTICDEYCRVNGIEFLTVKTLDESNPDIFYQRTRLFYQTMGFKPLEVFPYFWDEHNPCLFMAKYIGKTTKT